MRRSNQCVNVEMLESRVLLAGPSLNETNPFGAGTSAEASGKYTTFMPKMNQAGVKWMRNFPGWSTIQPTQTTWSWTKVDAYIANANANNMYLSAIFAYNAKWLTDGYPQGATELASWSTYVNTTVNHAKASVAYWEVWNEPQNFGSVPAAAYGGLVNTAYTAAKSADPNAQIGLSIASVDLNYLQQAIRNGAAGHYDYIAVHPYEIAGTFGSGQEALYMSVVPTIRKMLAVEDPSKVNVPIWFTEIGEAIGQVNGGVTVDQTIQAQDLIKIYSMGIAQGAACIQWFDALGGTADPYKMGLLDQNGNPYLCYTALKNLIANLGAHPQYQGWVQLNNKDYGFVFQGASTTVMVTWAPPGVTDTVNFGQSVQVMNPVTSAVSSVSSYSLTNAPILVIGVPTTLVTQAQANKTQPFPWGGDYTHAASVSLSMGATNTDAGLHMLYPNNASSATTLYGDSCRYMGTASASSFTIDPNFLSYSPTPIQITAVVSRDAANDNAGFNLKYESSTTTRLKSIGWNTVPSGTTGWSTMTWTITDSEFVADWGYNFSFASDSTANSQYYIKSITVTKLPPSAPTGLTATGISENQINLAWTDTSSNETNFEIDRATDSDFTQNLVTLTAVANATSYSDTGLAASTQFFYRVRAVSGDGESANSNSANAATWAPVPSTAQFQVNDGSAQRSMITSLAITIDQAVVLPLNALSLSLRGAAVGFTISVSPPSGRAKTFTLTFSGEGIIGSSLPDGAYTLTLDATLVKDIHGRTLSGGNRVFQFFRLFGDVNGDRVINDTDLNVFKSSLNQPTNYLWYLDFDQSLKVDNSDYIQFRQRMVKPLL